MTVRVDIRTPADGEAGDVARLPFKAAPGFAVAVWSHVEGRPAWRHPDTFAARPAAPAAAPKKAAP